MTFKRRLRSKASGVSWFLIDRGCEQQERNSPRDGIDTKDRDREVHSAQRGSTSVLDNLHLDHRRTEVEARALMVSSVEETLGLGRKTKKEREA